MGDILKLVPSASRDNDSILLTKYSASDLSVKSILRYIQYIRTRHLLFIVYEITTFNLMIQV